MRCANVDDMVKHGGVQRRDQNDDEVGRQHAERQSARALKLLRAILLDGDTISALSG